MAGNGSVRHKAQYRYGLLKGNKKWSPAALALLKLAARQTVLYERLTDKAFESDDVDGSLHKRVLEYSRSIDRLLARAAEGEAAPDLATLLTDDD